MKVPSANSPKVPMPPLTRNFLLDLFLSLLDFFFAIVISYSVIWNSGSLPLGVLLSVFYNGSRICIH